MARRRKKQKQWRERNRTIIARWILDRGKADRWLLQDNRRQPSLSRLWISRIAISCTSIRKTTFDGRPVKLSWSTHVVVPAFYRRRHRICLIQENATYHSKPEAHYWLEHLSPSNGDGSERTLPSASGTICASTSLTIGSLNDLKNFVTNSSARSITCGTIPRKRSKACSVLFALWICRCSR